MANKAECFEFIYYVVINKMADDVNLITCITGGDGRSSVNRSTNPNL